MTNKPPAGRKPIFIFPNDASDDLHGESSKQMLAALANIPASEWVGPITIQTGYAFMAPYENDEKIVVQLQVLQKPNYTAITLKSIRTGKNAILDPDKIIDLVNADIRLDDLDKSDLHIQTIKDLCARFVVIDHEELNAIPNIEPRLNDQSAYSRIVPYIISALSMEIPEENRPASLDTIEAWIHHEAGTIALKTVTSTMNVFRNCISQNNPVGQFALNIMNLEADHLFDGFGLEPSQRRNLHQARAERQFALSAKIAIDPLHAMQSFTIIDDLRTRFTPSEDYPSKP